MPVEIKGTFGSYALAGDGLYPDDEEAISAACEEMLSMCGNAGQETLIGDNLEDFFDWALQALEEEKAYAIEWTDFEAMVVEEWYAGRYDKWLGTDYIWGRGWMSIANQSGNHDSRDEYGEGTGQQFG